jgi:hypothetical protein
VAIELSDLFTPDAAGVPVSAVHATIANTPTSSSDELYVLVDAYDGSQQQWGPCRWVPAGGLPSEGDDCLLVLAEDDGAPWVLTSATEAGGGSGDLSFVFTQLSAAATWNVVHNLGKYPSVSVVDTGGNELLVTVLYIDANTLTISLASPTSGKAYMN